jgi:peptide subunit release factor 1 (eRF1)
LATQADLARLVSLEPSFPFLSVYLDLGPQARATRSYETLLRKRFSELGRIMDEDPETEARYWKAVKSVWDYVHNGLPVTARGVAIFVAPHLDLFEAFPVGQRFETEVVLNERPAVRPLAHVLEKHEHYLVAKVSADHAAIYMVHLRDAKAVSKLAEVESAVPGRTARGGFEGWSQKRFQLHRADHVHWHMKKVAEALAGLDAQYAASGLILLGLDKNLGELRRVLPGALAKKVMAEAPAPSKEGKNPLLQRVLPLIRMEEKIEAASTLERIAAGLGRGGLAVSGAEAVAAAVAQGRVYILAVGENFKAPGFQCEQCGAILTTPAADKQCVYCGGKVKEADLGEVLVEMAEKQGATVEVTPQTEMLDRLGGIAALLRY